MEHRARKNSNAFLFHVSCCVPLSSTRPQEVILRSDPKTDDERKGLRERLRRNDVELVRLRATLAALREAIAAKLRADGLA